ncbi:thiamine phosphate synthase [Metallumcola ferriviriculae]|uniref:Thiamine-phosphate synthase n=1 Tax=Metallumcola ferriviriculae TaxID=3039180 RepID=A0AAU0UN45_9FIRM|nr:thiamine phosphate synthase [Desulfitibacteraceae bacterium MK1]
MLYLVTNRLLVQNRNFLDCILDAAAGGVDAVILREKDLPDAELLALAKILQYRLGKLNIPLIVNGNLLVAKQTGAAGYHDGFHHFAQFTQECRNFSEKLGVSVHSASEAEFAAANGADYLLAGHIYHTASKPGLSPKGLQLIKEIKARVDIPVVAIGGIMPDNVEELLEAGADGIAAMSYILTAPNPGQAAGALKQRLKPLSERNDLLDNNSTMER